MEIMDWWCWFTLTGGLWALVAEIVGWFLQLKSRLVMKVMGSSSMADGEDGKENGGRRDA